MSKSNTLKKYYKNRNASILRKLHLAPELWETDNYNLQEKQSDIWSLGVILYELCTSKKPFYANNPASMKNKVLKDKYTPIPV